MAIRRCRSFTILDVMILVAATAFGICLGRAVVIDRSFRLLYGPIWFVFPVMHFLLPWTLAFIPIRLRQPRPSLSRLMHQPGMVACCAVAAITSIGVLTRAVPWLIPDGERGELDFSALIAVYGRSSADYIGLKTTAGPDIAELIGDDVLRIRCPHFGQWIARLETSWDAGE